MSAFVLPGTGVLRVTVASPWSGRAFTCQPRASVAEISPAVPARSSMASIPSQPLPSSTPSSEDDDFASGSSELSDPSKPSEPVVSAGTKPQLYATCSRCDASYQIDPKILAPSGKKVMCSVCSHTWYQKAEALLKLEEGRKFGDYPMEMKEKLMAEKAASRKDRGGYGPRSERERFPSRSGEGGKEEYSRGRSTSGRPRSDGSRAGSGASSGKFAVFIGNIPFSVTEEQLHSMVKQAGTVERVKIVQDATGRSKGFAFVDMATDQDAQNAIAALDGREISGRPLTVRMGRKRSW